MLRFLLVALNVVLVLLACFTLGGRVLMRQLDELEPRVNAALRPFDVQVSGLRGSFRGLDPVLRAERVYFPGGRAKSVELEPDVLESLLRLAFVARVASAEQLELTPVRTLDKRWTLGGAARGDGGGVAAVIPFLEHSDHLHLPNVRIRIAREAPDNLMDPLEQLADFEVSLQVDNDFSRHAGAVRLAQANDACSACALELRWDFEGLFGRIDRAGAVSLSGSGFRVPAALGRALGMGGATFARLDGAWTLENGDGSGRLVADLSDIVLVAGGLERLELDVHGTSRLWNTDVRLAFDRLAVRAAGHESVVDGARAALRSGLTATVFEWSIPEVDIATQVPLVAAAFERMRWAQEWLPALAPRGRIEAMSGRFAFAERRLTLAGEVVDLELEHHKNSPYVRNGRGSVIGSERGFRIRLKGRDMALGMLDFYPTPTQFDALDGDVHLWFRDRYLQIRGERLLARLGNSTAHAAFSVSRPPDAALQHVSFWVGVDTLDALVAKRFVPMKMSQNFRDWVDRAVVAGTANDVAVAFHGYTHSIGDLPVRRTELRFDAEDAAVRFHEDWPLAAAVDGRVVVSDGNVHAALTRATLRGVELTEGTIDAAKDERRLRVEGRGTADGVTLRHLVDDSPLAESLAFLRPDWRFEGPLSYRMSLGIPLGLAADGAAVSAPVGELEVAIDAELAGVRADLSNIGLVAEALRGPVIYRHPRVVSSPGLTGSLFGNDARFEARTQDGRTRIGFGGRAEVAALERWLDVPLAPRVSGAIDFAGDVVVTPASSTPVAIEVRTGLAGTTVDLPAPFGKTAEEEVPIELDVTPRGGAIYVSASAPFGNGWVRLEDGVAPAGTLALGGPPPAVDATATELVVTGAIRETDLGGWLAVLREREGRDGATGPAVALRTLRIAKLRLREVMLEDLLVDAFARDGVAGVTVVSEAIEGSLDVPRDGPMRVEVRHLRLPGSDTPDEVDPLAGLDMSFLTAADVAIEEATVGGAQYGAWRFGMRREGDVVRLEPLVGDLRGLHIEGSEPLTWRWREPAETRFTGRVSTADLAPVLTAFGYARSVETKKTRADVALAWPGSPLNFALRPLVGTIDARAEEGRFLEVESGAGPLRVFSLLNFTAIAKRMALDFSDVFGKGVSFEVLTGRLALEGQKVEFVEPLVMDGTGAYFRVSGRVDLATGALDNDMIVTLPVNKSLPWYAAYLGFVNPLAAGAVLVGERIFRNQIQQFSSATYKVSGTLEDPKVDFVGIFGRPSDEAATPAAVDTPVPKERKRSGRDMAEPS